MKNMVGKHRLSPSSSSTHRGLPSASNSPATSSADKNDLSPPVVVADGPHPATTRRERPAARSVARATSRNDGESGADSGSFRYSAGSFRGRVEDNSLRYGPSIGARARIPRVKVQMMAPACRGLLRANGRALG